MECIVGENVDGIEGREDPAVKVGLKSEKGTEERHEVGLEMVVVDVVKLGGLGSLGEEI